jgi:hypothetical protein
VTRTARSQTVQLDLPGQACVADGPHDQSGMYLMHHAFRRDLARFETAAGATPVEDAATWRALERRWQLFGEVLHHHHTVEDTSVWPLLRRRARAAGVDEAVTVLDAMEEEHDHIDPALAACASAWHAMVAHPCDDHRNALAITVSAARGALLSHMAHEETEALPLWQRLLSAADHVEITAAAKAGYPLRLVLGFILPWLADDLPAGAMTRLLDDAPPGYGLALRMARVGYDRGDRRAFRHG